MTLNYAHLLTPAAMTEVATNVYLKARVTFGLQRLYVGPSTFGYIGNAIETLMGGRRTMGVNDLHALETLGFTLRCDDCAGYVQVNNDDLTNDLTIECDAIEGGGFRPIWRHVS